MHLALTRAIPISVQRQDLLRIPTAKWDARFVDAVNPRAILPFELVLKHLKETGHRDVAPAFHKWLQAMHAPEVKEDERAKTSDKTLELALCGGYAWIPALARVLELLHTEEDLEKLATVMDVDLKLKKEAKQDSVRRAVFRELILRQLASFDTLVPALLAHDTDTIESHRIKVLRAIVQGTRLSLGLAPCDASTNLDDILAKGVLSSRLDLPPHPETPQLREVIRLRLDPKQSPAFLRAFLSVG